MSHSARPKTVVGLRIDHSSVDLDVSQLTWRPGVYALAFDHRSRVLLLDNQWNGKHDLPGGGVDIWEPVAGALAREVWEETGLEVEVGPLVHADDEFFLTPHHHHWHTIKLYYLVRVVGGVLREPIAEDEPSVNPHWVDPVTLRPDSLTLGWHALQKAITQPDRGAW